MQLTIDSSEPLAKILTVVGALYGVELSTASTASAPVETPAAAPRKRAAKRAPAAAEAPAPEPAAAAEPAVKKARPARKAKAAATAPAPESESSADGPLSQRVRAWARDNNLAVNSRGRLSTSVLAAYTAAHA